MIEEGIKRGWNNPYKGNDGATLMGAPTYPMLVELIERPMVERLRAAGLLSEFNVSLHRAELKNGRVIFYRQLDKFQRIQGLTINDAFVDEAAITKEEAIDEIQNRQLTTGGSLIVASTPKGVSNWFYKRYFGSEARENPHREIIEYQLEQNPAVTPEYVDYLKSQKDSLLVQQDIYGQFVVLTEGRVYRSFDPAQNIRPYRPPDHGGDVQVYIGLDYNVDIMAWIAMVEIGRNSFHVIHESVGAPTTKQVGEEIVAKFGRNVIVIDDAASGRARQQGSGLVNRQILQQVGLTNISSHSKNPYIERRVSVVNAMFENGLGQHRLFIDPGCRKLTEEMQTLTYLPNGKPDDEGGKRGHLSDALGYCTMYLTGGNAASLSASNPM